MVLHYRWRKTMGLLQPDTRVSVALTAATLAADAALTAAAALANMRCMHF